MTPHDPDVVVVGGGPAGSTIAGLLAGRGYDVLILDRARFPRPKPCGECVDPGAVAALERLGMLDRVLRLGPVRLRGWRLHGRLAEVSAPFGAELHGLGVPRLALDVALLDHARAAGARVEEGAHVVGVVPASPGERPSVEVRRRGRLRPRVVVGADGLRSVVVRSLDLVTRAPRLRKVSLTAHVQGEGLPRDHGALHVSGGVTLGVAPVGEDLWNVTVVTEAPPSSGELAAEPARFMERVLRSRFPTARWAFVDEPLASGPFDWPVRRAWIPGVVLVGDAAGYYDPFTGQGIYRALRTAELAAEAIVDALGHGGWTALARYHRRWAREVRWSRRVQRGVEAVMSREPVREAVLARLRASGGLQAVIRVTGDAALPATLLSPSVWLGGRAAPTL